MPATKGFAITSPDIERRAKRMAATPISDVVRKGAVVAARSVVSSLQETLRGVGASEGLVKDVKVFDMHPAAEVLRARANREDVIVGVGPASKYAVEADDLEWGSATTPAYGWVRHTVGQHRRDITQRWSNAITTELDRRCL